MFKQVEPIRLSDAVVTQIAQAITAGQLNVGDRIPSERELMRQMGVGRASVREALRQLQTMGLIEVRPGQVATVVNTPAQAPMAQFWKHWLLLHAEQALQLMDVREALETRAAALAAESTDEAAIGQLAEANARLAEIIPESEPEARAEADIAFHIALVEASGNRLLMALTQSLAYTLHELRIAAYSEIDQALRSVEEHAAIVQAIAAHDPDAAQRALNAHLRSSKRFLTENARPDVPVGSAS